LSLEFSLTYFYIRPGCDTISGMSGFAPDPRPSTAVAPDAATYTEQTGNECPLYNAAQANKTWYATDLDAVGPASPQAYCYLGFDGSGNPAVLQVTVTAAIMRSVNIGVFGAFESYAAYVAALPPSPSTASYAPPFDTLPPTPITAWWLSTPAEAAMVVKEMAGAGIIASAEPLDSESGSLYTYDPSDPRRVYEIQIRSGVSSPAFRGYQLRLLLQQRFASGVWSPGDWRIDPARGPVFTPETFPATNPSTLPLPIDPKYADATQWQVFAQLGGVLGVRPVGSAPPDTTALTVTIAQQVQAIYTKIVGGA